MQNPVQRLAYTGDFDLGLGAAVERFDIFQLTQGVFVVAADFVERTGQCGEFIGQSGVLGRQIADHRVAGIGLFNRTQGFRGGLVGAQQPTAAQPLNEDIHSGLQGTLQAAQLIPFRRQQRQAHRMGLQFGLAQTDLGIEQPVAGCLGEQRRAEGLVVRLCGKRGGQIIQFTLQARDIVAQLGGLHRQLRQLGFQLAQPRLRFAQAPLRAVQGLFHGRNPCVGQGKRFDRGRGAPEFVDATVCLPGCFPQGGNLLFQVGDAFEAIPNRLERFVLRALADRLRDGRHRRDALVERRGILGFGHRNAGKCEHEKSETESQE